LNFHLFWRLGEVKKFFGSGPRVLRFLFISYNKEAAAMNLGGMKAGVLGNLTASTFLLITYINMLLL